MLWRHFQICYCFREFIKNCLGPVPCLRYPVPNRTPLLGALIPTSKWTHPRSPPVMWDPGAWLLACALSSFWAVQWLWRRCTSDFSLKSAVSGDANRRRTRLLQILPEITNNIIQLTQASPSHAVNSEAGTLLARPPLSDCRTSLPSPSPSPPPSSPRRLPFLSLLTYLTKAACWAPHHLPATHCETSKSCFKHWLSGQWQHPWEPTASSCSRMNAMFYPQVSLYPCIPPAAQDWGHRVLLGAGFVLLFF